MNGIEDILRQELTPEQFAAATDTSNEILCLACAGSGKSTTLAYRIAWLVAQGATPSSIVAFTFTEKAADAIKLRVSQSLERIGWDPAILGAMYIGTMHSYCQYLLREIDSRYRQFDVLDENRFKLYLISRYYQLELQRIQAVHFPPNRANRNNTGYFKTVNEVATAWSILNDEMLSMSAVTAHDSTLGQILEGIRNSLNENEFIDFSLMIRLVVDALERGNEDIERAINNLAHLMVDEYQDVNPAQERLIQLLHQRSNTLFVVGDDDQSIYAWRGADVRNILTFHQRYPNGEMHTLATNFRSTPVIVRSADAFAAAELGATRYVKNPQSSGQYEPNDFAALWFDTRQEEAEWVAERIETLLGTRYEERDGQIRGLTPADFAILMRSTARAEQNGMPRHMAFSQSLIDRGIYYSLEAGGSIFDRSQVRVLRDTFELLRNVSPDRNVARSHFDNVIVPVYLHANFNSFAAVMADWGRRIHGPISGVRRRVYPQQLVHDLLESFHLAESNFDDGTLQDIGAFSRMVQDVELVYMSIDTTRRFQQILNFIGNVAESGYNTGTADILRRPDAVTISTVHKMKGLEAPVVFIVDVEHLRFPGRRRNYNGWLPTPVLQNALQRNAYIGTREEEARLFYTALTRAERFLYVTGSMNLPGGRSQRKESPFTQRLNDSEIHNNLDVPRGLVSCSPERRIDETVVPTSYSDIRYYLKCPKDYQFRKSFGFSPPIVDMFGFGLTVHAAVCKLHEIYNAHVPSSEQAEQVARDIFHLKHVPQSNDPENHPGPYERACDSAAKILREYAESYSDDFIRRRQVEVRFEISVSQAVISGSIDLMLHEDKNGRLLDAEVIDFKAVEGGEEAEQNKDLHWSEMTLQVQLYAKAAQEVLGQNARTGGVHLLKDNQRISVPVDDNAIQAAVENVEWAVGKIIAGDFPMRPEKTKCENCDFRQLCTQIAENFQTDDVPPPIHIPGSTSPQMARAFSEYDG